MRSIDGSSFFLGANLDYSHFPAVLLSEELQEGHWFPVLLPLHSWQKYFPQELHLKM